MDLESIFCTKDMLNFSLTISEFLNPQMYGHTLLPKQVHSLIPGRQDTSNTKDFHVFSPSFIVISQFFVLHLRFNLLVFFLQVNFCFQHSKETFGFIFLQRGMNIHGIFYPSLGKLWNSTLFCYIYRGNQEFF